MYSLVRGVRLIHYWNKENEQCLVKICMRTVNITIYHGRCARIMKKKNAVCFKNKICYELEGKAGVGGLQNHHCHKNRDGWAVGDFIMERLCI